MRVHLETTRIPRLDLYFLEYFFQIPPSYLPARFRVFLREALPSWRDVEKVAFCGPAISPRTQKGSYPLGIVL